MNQPIKLILCDIDGCLNAGLQELLDLQSISVIAKQIRMLAKRGVSFSLCTGRPVPFAQAVSQMIGATAALVCENGAVVFDPASGIATTLASSSELTALAQLGEEILQSPKWQVSMEPGKSACVSLNGPEITGCHPDKVKSVICEMQTLPNSEDFNWTFSSTAIDITPKNIDKSVGAQHLLDSMGLKWSQVASIGDSSGDLPVLTKAALSLCPENSIAAVKQVVDRCAEQSFSAGVAQLLQVNFFNDNY